MYSMEEAATGPEVYEDIGVYRAVLVLMPQQA